MKRAIALTLALVALALAGSALGSASLNCGRTSYRATSQGQSISGQDTVFVLRGAIACATARSVDRRADEGLRTSGWRCAFSQRNTVTTCTNASRHAQIKGLAYVNPATSPTPTAPVTIAAPVSTPTIPTPTPTPVPVPVPIPTPVPTTTTTTTPTPSPTSCYPLSNSGTCYEPGEFCRTSDHGTSGVAGDGEAITCEYNNGWRWEPTS